jgi:hypothetical protein
MLTGNIKIDHKGEDTVPNVDGVFSISEEITSYSAPKEGLEEWYKSLTDGSRKFYGMCMEEAFIRTILLDTMDEGKTVRRLCQEDM